ncbi:MAG: hypothetical protein HFH45_03585 [Bacilli bacterium]|nr:hypothetical protein [Bacilli bacterium]
MKNLEEILQEYFGLKGNLFLKKPKVVGRYYDGEPDYEYMTKKGARAYCKLINLLDDLRNLGVVNFDIDDLDELTEGEE